MKQQQAVIEYFIQNNNEPMHYSDIAQELNIIVHNMRRILGQGEKKDIFIRVSVGTYKFNNK